MTDTTPETEHHPYDPAVRTRLKAFLAAVPEGIVTIAIRPGASLRRPDLEQQLARDEWSDKTRLELAEACATQRAHLDDMRAEAETLTISLQDARKATQGAYNERAHLVALLAAIYPSTWGIDFDEPGWHVVYVQLPTGQASWHISPNDRDLFAHVPGPSGEWDGHTTEQKYDRIDKLAATLGEPARRKGA